MNTADLEEVVITFHYISDDYNATHHEMALNTSEGIKEVVDEFFDSDAADLGYLYYQIENGPLISIEGDN